MDTINQGIWSLHLQKILDSRAIILPFPPEFRSQTKLWCLVMFLFTESVMKSLCWAKDTGRFAVNEILWHGTQVPHRSVSDGRGCSQKSGVSVASKPAELPAILTLSWELKGLENSWKSSYHFAHLHQCKAELWCRQRLALLRLTV